MKEKSGPILKRQTQKQTLKWPSRAIRAARRPASRGVRALFERTREGQKRQIAF
jgi:hypothetical protein